MRIGACKYAVALLCAAAFSLPGSASAQTTNAPSYELSAGYQFTHVPDQSMPLGFAIDAARNSGIWSIVGELGWAYDSEDLEDDAEASLQLWHYGAGVRVNARQHASMWPFAQIIVGGVTARSSFEGFGVDDTDTSSHFMIQPGVGVTFVAGDGWGIVGQVDYRRVFLDEEEFGESGENEFRVFVGVRMILD